MQNHCVPHIFQIHPVATVRLKHKDTIKWEVVTVRPERQLSLSPAVSTTANQKKQAKNDSVEHESPIKETPAIKRHSKLWQSFNACPGGRAGEMDINRRYSIAKDERYVPLTIASYPLTVCFCTRYSTVQL